MSNSLEDYIEAVRNIELEKGCATVGEIAEALNVKKPSVSLAMKQLKERGLVEYTQYSPIVLTKSGRHEADRVISCHTIVKEFLMTVLHMKEPRADEVACGIEHIMSLRKFPDSSCSRTMSGSTERSVYPNRNYLRWSSLTLSAFPAD